MTDSRVASLAALLRDFEDFLREELSLPRFREAQSHLAGIRNVTAESQEVAVGLAVATRRHGGKWQLTGTILWLSGFLWGLVIGLWLCHP